MTGEHDKDFQQYQALDLKIAKALQIDVPELRMPELPDVDAPGATPLPQRKRSMKPVWFAIAASVVLATSISVRMSGVFESHESLADAVLAHIDHEPDALRVSDIAVSDDRLARAVPASLAVYERGDFLITYAKPCVINGNSVPHLVVQGKYGPITILLMRDEKLAEVTPIDGDNVKGVILPVGDGSIAIVGGRDEPLEAIRKNVLNSVTWTA
ncbi:MAG: DUF3379 family protein [Woeseiaceae bacterium]|jgi:hypothetical protein